MNDIWAVGVLIHLLLTGKMPVYPSQSKEYSFDQATLEDVSDAGREFVRQLLSLTDRPSAASALEFPFFTQPNPNPVSLEEAQKRLLQQKALLKVEYLTYQCLIEHWLAIAEKEKVTEVLTALDTGAKPTVEELKQSYCVGMGKVLSSEELSSLAE
jgi:serine/threonine protein kinase